MMVELKQCFRRWLGSPNKAQWLAPLRMIRNRLGWRRHSKLPSECKRILVIRPDEIGDVVLTSPFFRNLRKGAPHAKITALTNETCRHLLEECPYIDELHTLPFKPSIEPCYQSHLVLAALKLKWSKFLGGFDLVLLPRVDADWYNAELVAHLLAGCGAVLMNSASFVYWSNSPPESGALKDFRYAVCKPQNDALSDLEFLKRCGGTVDTENLEFWKSENDSAAVKKWLSAHVAGARKLVFHPPGGRSQLRRWPAGRSSEFVEKLLVGTDFSIIVVGGPEDEHYRQEFSSLRHLRLKVALGEFSLTELGALIQTCGYFVGGDSGPMHIAAAVGAKTIGIFGPGSEKRFRPFSQNARVVSTQAICAPDGSQTYEACCQSCIYPENRCLTELSADRVLEEVVEFMRPAN